MTKKKKEPFYFPKVKGEDVEKIKNGDYDFFNKKNYDIRTVIEYFNRIRDDNRTIYTGMIEIQKEFNKDIKYLSKLQLIKITALNIISTVIICFIVSKKN